MPNVVSITIKKTSLYPDHPENPKHNTKDEEYPLHPIYPGSNPNDNEPYDK